MRTLARTILTPTEHGEPLPDCFPPFTRHGITLRRRQLTMFAAPPASAKSFLVLKLIELMKLPTLYFSPDTDASDQMDRAAAMVTGETQSQVREDLAMGADDYYSSLLAESFGHVRWVFETDPTYEDLLLETEAFAEAFGAFPEIIVVDNLMNVMGEAESEYAAQKETTKVLHRLRRITGASVWLVHHMNETKADPSYPAPRVDLANKLAQIPEVILSISRGDTSNVMRVAVVKGRGMKQDPTGKTYTEFYADLETGTFYKSRYDMEAGLAIR